MILRTTGVDLAKALYKQDCQTTDTVIHERVGDPKVVKRRKLKKMDDDSSVC
jgi:hypothetical protein